MYCITIFLTLLACLVTARESDYCLADDDNPYLYFATKSAYNFMHGEFKPERNCRPVQLFVVSRHGTRYPGSKSIPKMKILYKLRDQIVSNHLEQRLGHLCDYDLENFRNWKLDDNVREDMADFLSPQGETDLKGLAVRLRAAFPELLTPTDYNSMHNYVFRSTKTQRTEESMRAFIEGLFGGRNSVIPEIAPNNDTLLRANKECPSWEEETGSSKYLEERDKFNNGPEMQNLYYNVSRRLGFRENITLDSVNSMYDMCRFEKAWRIDKVSPWCAAFSKWELRILEFREDLDYYYYVGPGREINVKLGCPLMKDLFHHFRKLEGDDYYQEPKGIFYFAHTVTLQTLLAALGFNDDPQPLLASNYKTSAGRHWRTSFIGPFATNLVAVFYKCNDSMSSNVVNKVIFHWAERLVRYEGCNVGLCNWDYIKDRLERKANECNMNFCFNASGLSRLSNFSIIHLVLSLFLLLVGHKQMLF